jgi:hypothetical protein
VVSADNPDGDILIDLPGTDGRPTTTVASPSFDSGAEGCS